MRTRQGVLNLMTMPAPTAQALELPPPNFPVVTRVVSNAPLGSSADPPIVWILESKHPLESRMKIMRMFINDDEVEIYATDGHTCVRNCLPRHMVRLTEEGMPPDKFVEEIEAAENEAAANAPIDDPEEEPPTGLVINPPS
jgi:hypothetical protein